MMNFHPMLVHFPIALLTLYTLCELFRVKRLQENKSFQTVKKTLVIVGAITAIVARQAGEMVEEMFENGPDGNLVEMHALFGNATTIIFCLIAGAYIIELSRMRNVQTAWAIQVYGALRYISLSILRPAIVMIFAFAGLFAITIAGALGGAIAHGPDVDPFVSFIYGIFF